MASNSCSELSITQLFSFDVKNFIGEVRKRPALWNSSHEDYKNRTVRQDAWFEICKIFAPDFQEKNEEEQLMIGRELQQKWKYIRDAYIRQLRHAALNKTRSGAAKTYVYAKQLGFLNLSPVDYIQEDEVKAGWRMRRRHFIRPRNNESVKPRRWKQTERDLEESEVEPSSSHDVARETTNSLEKQMESTMSDDVAFFRSLLPTLSELKPSQKLLFRIDVMKILHSYATEANSTNSVFPPHSANNTLRDELHLSKSSPNREECE